MCVWESCEASDLLSTHRSIDFFFFLHCFVRFCFLSFCVLLLCLAIAVYIYSLIPFVFSVFISPKPKMTATGVTTWPYLFRSHSRRSQREVQIYSKKDICPQYTNKWLKQWPKEIERRQKKKNSISLAPFHSVPLYPPVAQLCALSCITHIPIQTHLYKDNFDEIKLSTGKDSKWILAANEEKKCIYTAPHT